MGRGRWALLGLTALVLLVASGRAQGEGQNEIPFEALVQKPFTGDFDEMAKRRLIRVLVVPSKTFYFVDRGTQRGLSYDRAKAFEDEINKKLKSKTLRVEMVFIPVHQDELLPALLKGQGDIAAANLTITPERQKFVDFSEPFWTGVDEVVVTGPSSPPIESVDDLSGKEVFVRPSSSYFQSLWHLNETLTQAGKKPVIIRSAPEQLADEDILEMLNAGLVEFTIVDSHKVNLWTKVLPKIKPHYDVAVRKGGEIAWAYRKNSPQLAAAVNDFAKTHGRGTGFGNAEFEEYLKSLKYVKDATSQAELAKFLRTIQIFQKYAGQYDFDWLLLAAQGYQESRLDQNVHSPVGAVGVMQVMPTTGKELDVGDVHQIEPNIHAGAKYLRTTMDRYFPEGELDPLNRALFAFASYNAGPAKVAKLRQEAKQQGLDPNVWFGNVEVIAAKRIGQETVSYVGNIYKYYVAYKLVVDAQKQRDEARKQAEKP